MTTNFGTDAYSVDEVDETRTVTGVALVAQDAFWRLQTEHAQGILEEDAPDYGLDLEGLIGSIETESDAAALPGKIEGELTKDPRILTAKSTVARVVESNGAISYDIAVRCETAEGPFELIGKAGDAGFDLAVKLLPGNG